MLQYASNLHDAKMKVNLYKKKVLEILQNNHLLSIGGIHKKIGTINYSTVYRNIQQLLGDKKIKKIVFSKSKIMYEVVCLKNNHDHFICNKCEKIEELNIPAKKISLPEEYILSDIVVKGICKKCQ